jgi:membrane protease YdiL (CAAX protease family)
MAEHVYELPGRLPAPASPPRPFTHIIRRRPLAAFFVLAFVFSWWPSIFYVVNGSGWGILGCGPFLAALTVVSLTDGRPGLKKLFRSMLKWRVGLRWWALAFFGPVVLSGTATLLNLALGASAPAASDWNNWTNVLPTALFILLVPIAGGAWEEPGWRGYALPRLLAERSALTASLLLGALWAVWHLPVYLTGDQHWSDLVLVVLATVLFTWLFENAMQSALIAMVLHATNNAVSGEYFSQLFDGGDSTRQSWLLALVWGVAALFVVLFARRFRRAAPQRP